MGPQFVQCLNCDRIHEINEVITEIMTYGNVSENDIDNIYSEVKNILCEGADVCGCTKNNRWVQKYLTFLVAVLRSTSGRKPLSHSVCNISKRSGNKCK